MRAWIPKLHQQLGERVGFHSCEVIYSYKTCKLVKKSRATNRASNHSEFLVAVLFASTVRPLYHYSQGYRMRFVCLILLYSPYLCKFVNDEIRVNKFK